MPTISDIFDGANWHERETRDMFGVVFTGHPYLEPLLLPEEDADRRPLLKAEGELKTADKISAQPKKDEAEPPAEEEP
jgi:NADH-quinone oxidoreductase subunit C